MNIRKAFLLTLLPAFVGCGSINPNATVTHPSAWDKIMGATGFDQVFSAQKYQHAQAARNLCATKWGTQRTIMVDSVNDTYSYRQCVDADIPQPNQGMQRFTGRPTTGPADMTAP